MCHVQVLSVPRALCAADVNVRARAHAGGPNDARVRRELGEGGGGEG